MNASSLELIEQDELSIQHKKVPDWLESFLNKTFFDSCSLHELQKNELNQYCITCDSSACRHCISGSLHEKHKLLQIHRLLYKDVVPLDEMNKHINCSKIQPYKCNKKLVIALNPLPHTGSGSQIDGNATCDTCKRRLHDPLHYRFCSISCKVDAFNRKTNDLEPPFLEIDMPPLTRDEAINPAGNAERVTSAPTINEAENGERCMPSIVKNEADQAKNAERGKRRRKGVPRRG